MPIKVHLPDGRVVNFPDGMAPGEIQAAMRRLSGAAPDAQPSMPAGAIDPNMPRADRIDDQPARPQQRLAGVGIQTVPDEEWAAMTPAQRMQGVLKAAGYGLSSMMGMGQAGRDAVDHPGITLATAALPGVAQGVRAAVPSLARAGANFQTVMAAARNQPVDIANPGNTALRIMQMAERGGTMPKVVRDFIRRVTDPEKAGMTYEEARDFASNISRLSVAERTRLTPALRREVGNLRVQLNHAVEKAAESAGQGDRYRSAMREYARRAQLNDAGRDVWTGVKRAFPYATGAGAGLYGAQTLSDLLRGN